MKDEQLIKILNEYNFDAIENSNVIKELRAFKSQSKDKSLKERIQWEIDFLQFELQSGKACPFAEFIDGNGVRSGHPNFDLFSNKALEYLRERAKETINRWLQIHYNQVLWNCPKTKSLVFAKEAINSYLNLFQKLNADDYKQYQIIEWFENGVNLSENANFKNLEFKSIWNTLVNSDDVLKGYWRTRLIEVVFNLNSYTSKDYEDKLKLCVDLYKQFLTKESFHTTESILNTALSIAKKLQKDLKPIFKLLGENYEYEANTATGDSSNFIACTSLVKSLEYYQEAKEESKIEEVAIRLAKLRKELHLDLIEIDYTNPASIKIRKSIEHKVEELLEKPTEQIYLYLSQGNDEELFIGESALTEDTSEKAPSFLNAMNTWNIDINNNQREGINGSFNAYEWYVKFELNYFLFLLFTKGIERGKIDYVSFNTYLEKESWLGQKFRSRSGGGNMREYTWLSLIAPSINEYFKQTQILVDDKQRSYNYILCTDSLTLKFEGLLRDFASLIGCETIIYSKRLKGTREMYVDELLKQEKLQSFFAEADNSMFGYIFTKRGLDLRNNIAHCFMRYPDYGFAEIHLLLLTILRVSKYQVQGKT